MEVGDNSIVEAVASVAEFKIAGWQDLPVELRERIMFSVPPVDRLNCRLACRLLNAVVKTSMRDVVALSLMHLSTCNKTPSLLAYRLLRSAEELAQQKSTLDDGASAAKKSKPDSQCRCILTTMHPYTKVQCMYTYKLAPLDVIALLEFAGARVETLSMSTHSCLSDDNAMLSAIRLILEALSDSAPPVRCPCLHLAHLSIDSCYLINGDGVLRLLLMYVKSLRSKQARSLLSLALTANRSGCCEQRTARFLHIGHRSTMIAGQIGRLSVATEETRTSVESPSPESSSRAQSPTPGTSSRSEPPAAASSTCTTIGRGFSFPLLNTRRGIMARGGHDDQYVMDRDELVGDDEYFRRQPFEYRRAHGMYPTLAAPLPNASPPIRPSPMDDDPYFQGEICGPAVVSLLQAVLNASPDLKVLDIDGLLVAKETPLTHLIYPPSLINLKTARLGRTTGDLRRIANDCPNLETIDSLNSSFMVHDDDIEALVSLASLRSLSFATTGTGDTTNFNRLNQLAFGDRPYGPSMRRPWPHLRIIKLHATTGSFLHLLSIACPYLEEVSIRLDDTRTRLTETQLLPLKTLTHLRSLIIESLATDPTNNADIARMVITDRLLDALVDNCPMLERLSVTPCAVTLLALPRLLRECTRLRFISIRSVSMCLKTLDCLVMIRSVACDLRSRQLSTIIEVKEIVGDTYESVGRILDGLDPSTVMALSSMSDSCVHDMEVCERCRFKSAPLSPNSTLNGGRNSGSARSLVLADRSRPNAALVFSAPAATVAASL